jgi:SNF2 family DNA or RNA helicase
MQKLIGKIDDLRASVRSIDSSLSVDCNLSNISLRAYQSDGIKWLIERFTSNIGCILADEMGLGKTCQTIGLIQNILTTKSKAKILVISPLSVVNNWCDELTRFASSVHFIVYKGITGFLPSLKPQKFTMMGVAVLKNSRVTRLLNTGRPGLLTQSNL